MKTLGKNKKNKKADPQKLKKLVSASKKAGKWDEATMPFMSSFLATLIKEADEPAEDALPPEEFTNDQNKADFEAGLDAETPKDQTPAN